MKHLSYNRCIPRLFLSLRIPIPPPDYITVYSELSTIFRILQSGQESNLRVLYHKECHQLLISTLGGATLPLRHLTILIVFPICQRVHPLYSQPTVVNTGLEPAQGNHFWIWVPSLITQLTNNPTSPVGWTGCHVGVGVSRYFGTPWYGLESNQWHKVFQTFALPTELPYQM